MPFVRERQTVAQTNKELVAAPAADKQIIVDMVYMSSDTAQTGMLESGNADLRWEQYIPANGGMIVEAGGEADNSGLFRCAAGKSLTYTTSAAGKFFVATRYRIVQDTGE